jgi:hypothetical protein
MGSAVADTVTTTIDRLGEITAIFEDLERRRLEAIYTGDVEAFTALFADTPYLDRSLEVFDLVTPGTPPSVSIDVLEVLRDDETCLATWATTVVDETHTDPVSTVLIRENGEWRIAYVGGEKEGWLCDGPHPLSP